MLILKSAFQVYAKLFLYWASVSESSLRDYLDGISVGIYVCMYVCMYIRVVIPYYIHSNSKLHDNFSKMQTLVILVTLSLIILGTRLTPQCAAFV